MGFKTRKRSDCRHGTAEPEEALRNGQGRTIKRNKLFMAMLGLFAFVCMDARAVSWSSQEYVALSAEYNDNKTLTVNDHDTVVGGIAELALDIKGETELNRLWLNPRLKFSRYNGQEGFDSDDQYIYTSYQHISERSRFEFKADYIRDSPITSELQDLEYVQTNTRRDTLDTGPVWMYRINDSIASNVGVNYLAVNYPDADGSGLIDYTYGSAFAGLKKMLGESMNLGLTAYGSRFDAQEVENETDDVGVQLSLESEFYQALTFNIMYSWHESTIKIGPDGSLYRDTLPGRLLNLDIEKQFERSAMNFSVTNEVRPGSRGLLEQHDRYKFNYDYRVSAHTTAQIFLADTFVDDVSGSPLFVGWEYRQATALLNYRLYSDWYVWGSYQYAWKQFDNTESSAESHAVLLSVRYQGL